MSLIDDIKMFGRFAWRLRSFLRHPISLEDAQRIVRHRLAERNTQFLRLIERGIMQYPGSPYLPLLKRADCSLDDIRDMVQTRGLEETLRSLRNSGVYITFEEFKGRTPIVRDGIEFEVRSQVFDNPFLMAHYQTETGGSTGAGTRVSHDLDHLAEAAPHLMLTRHMHGVLDTPTAVWRGILPDGSGINNMLRASHFGRIPDRWFAHNVTGGGLSKYRVATYFTVCMSRLCARPLPWPESVPLDQGITVARWATETARTHGACLVMAPVSRALRVCLAAVDAGLDLSGVTFIIAGEPLTPAKIQGITASGAQYFSTYGAAETGRMGMGCLHPVAHDDVHLLTDAFAVITHPSHIPGTDETVPALNVTTLLPSAPKLMLNVELDDYAVVEERSCGCPWESFGFTTHLRQIRSFRKLTGEGVSLVGSDMVRILEEVLPDRFSGTPLDYQLVEEEDENGFTRLNLYIHPRIDLRDESMVITTVMDALASGTVAAGAARNTWDQAQALRIKRAEPVWTNRGKLMPLHLAGRGAPQ